MALWIFATIHFKLVLINGSRGLDCKSVTTFESRTISNTPSYVSPLSRLPVGCYGLSDVLRPYIILTRQPYTLKAKTLRYCFGTKCWITPSRNRVVIFYSLLASSFHNAFMITEQLILCKRIRNCTIIQQDEEKKHVLPESSMVVIIVCIYHHSLSSLHIYIYIHTYIYIYTYMSLHHGKHNTAICLGNPCSWNMYLSICIWLVSYMRVYSVWQNPYIIFHSMILVLCTLTLKLQIIWAMMPDKLKYCIFWSLFCKRQLSNLVDECMAMTDNFVT